MIILEDKGLTQFRHETICPSVFSRHGAFMVRQDLEVIHSPYLNINFIHIFVFKNKILPFIILQYDLFYSYRHGAHLKLKPIYLGIITKCKQRNIFNK